MGKKEEVDILMEQGMKTIHDWHDHEGIGKDESELLSSLCALITETSVRIPISSPEEYKASANATRVVLETAVQIGRAIERKKQTES